MPNNRNLGGVYMTDADGQMSRGALASTEFVCGLIFDTSIYGGVSKALSGDAAKTFANGNVVEMNNSSDMKTAGIDETQMGGLPYHHINNFFSLAGKNQRLFVSFMNSAEDTKFEAVEKMQLAANGIIYQIGLWTGVPFAVVNSDDYEIEGDSLFSKLEVQAENLGGKVGVTNYDGNQPVNIIVNAPPLDQAEIDYKKLPDLSDLNLPKVSIMLGQPSTDKVHQIQLNLIKATDGTPHYVQVGNIGAILACLAVAPVEENIGAVENFNLSTVMTSCELGFGNIALNTQKDGFVEGASFNNVKTINYSNRNNMLQAKNYNFLRDYEGVEYGVFISDDMTLSNGDYRSLTRCRTIHKSRRAVRMALLPLVKKSWTVDTSTGYMTDADVTVIQNAVYDALDKNMVDPGTTTSQISGRVVNIDGQQNILENDQLLIEYSIVPKGYSSAIFVREGFTSTITT